MLAITARTALVGLVLAGVALAMPARAAEREAASRSPTAAVILVGGDKGPGLRSFKKPGLQRFGKQGRHRFIKRGSRSFKSRSFGMPLPRGFEAKAPRRLALQRLKRRGFDRHGPPGVRRQRFIAPQVPAIKPRVVPPRVLTFRHGSVAPRLRPLTEDSGIRPRVLTLGEGFSNAGSPTLKPQRSRRAGAQRIFVVKGSGFDGFPGHRAAPRRNRGKHIFFGAPGPKHLVIRPSPEVN